MLWPALNTEQHKELGILLQEWKIHSVAQAMGSRGHMEHKAMFANDIQINKT